MRLLRLLPLLLLGAACGSETTEPEVQVIETATFAPSLGIDLATFTKNANGLYFKELVVGTGTLSENGNLVGVRYKGQLIDGSVFDENPVPKAVLTFRIGAGTVVPGFEQGARGMRVGGKRMVIIPPVLGYGSRGSGSVPANAIMIFTIDLVSVQP